MKGYALLLVILATLMICNIVFAQRPGMNYFPYSRTPRPTCLDGKKPVQDPSLHTLLGGTWKHGVCPEDQFIGTKWFTGPWSQIKERDVSGDIDALEAMFKALSDIQTKATNRLKQKTTQYEKAYAEGARTEATFRKVGVAAEIGNIRDREAAMSR